jgi:hypothetical protein
MSKMKDLIIDIAEMYDDNFTIKQISDHTGLPQDVVFDILQKYSWRIVDDSELIQ